MAAKWSDCPAGVAAAATAATRAAALGVPPPDERREEWLEVLNDDGSSTGTARPRAEVHARGLVHSSVHTWLVAPDGHVLVQLRAPDKDSWPGRWDISSAGHISAGDTALESAVRELEEELGLCVTPDALEPLFVHEEHFVTNGGAFINNEFAHVFLLTLAERIPASAMALQTSEVAAVKWIPIEELHAALVAGDEAYVPQDMADDKYGRLTALLRARFTVAGRAAAAATLSAKLRRYHPVDMGALGAGDAAAAVGALSEPLIAALRKVLQAAQLMSAAYERQVWAHGAAQAAEARRTLARAAAVTGGGATGAGSDAAPASASTASEGAASDDGAGVDALDVLTARYHELNKGPFCILDEDEAFTRTGPVVSYPQPHGRAPLRVRMPVPAKRPPAGTLYPQGVTAEEFRAWTALLPEAERTRAEGYFTVITRGNDGAGASDGGAGALTAVPYSEHFAAQLHPAAALLREAAACVDGDSELAGFANYLRARADAFESNDYFESDVLWLGLRSPVDVTIGPYETYIDGITGLKASFEAFVGLTDPGETDKLRSIGAVMQQVELALPMPESAKNKDVGDSAPIRVVNLLYSAGDVGGPQTLAFNLPNDERVVKAHGTAQVLMRNVSQAKFEHLLKPIARLCLTPRDADAVEFDAFFSHTLCHELSHGIGPHTITLVDADAAGGGGAMRETSVRLELQELHSALEEAKADIVGLWMMPWLMRRGLLPASMLRAIYPTFLAGCLRSVRFGLEEAHGKAQAMAFNFLVEAGVFGVAEDGLLCVVPGEAGDDAGRDGASVGAGTGAGAGAGGDDEPPPVEGETALRRVAAAVASACAAILEVQAAGDKAGAKALLDKYGVRTPGGLLDMALKRLEADTGLAVDIVPSFSVAEGLLRSGE